MHCKLFQLMLLTYFLLSACKRNPQRESAPVEESNSPSVLDHLPSDYFGYMNCNDCDSIRIDFFLNTDMQYTITKTYLKTKSDDSAKIDKGEWTIDHENYIHLNSFEDGGMFSSVKIINSDTIIVEDSLKSIELTRQNSIN
jgi:hypothetical protein